MVEIFNFLFYSSKVERWGVLCAETYKRNLKVAAKERWRNEYDVA